MASLDVRVGIGYDVHPFEAGRRLLLGGVEIEGEDGLAGHSDGDSALHALADALLGASGLGDIGRHFPADDPAYEGADSRELLSATLKLVRLEGFEVGNVDVTIIAERPTLQPHLERMRFAIAEVLRVDSDCVNVKATRHEGLGAIGRGEGIAATAVALLCGK